MDITKKQLARLDQEICNFLRQDRQFILERMQQRYAVDEKTGRRDLVTTLDKENQRRIIAFLKSQLGSAKILAEETEHQITDFTGLFWVIDPIDGTMNFVKQGEDFAVMIALYEDGQPLLGYIYDVMRDRLLHGGPGIDAAFCNEVKLAAPADLPLANGLVGLSGPMLIANKYNFQTIEAQSLGSRVLGSAGIEFSRVILGKQVGYASTLKPWDFAAGNALASVLGLMVDRVDGRPLNMLKSGVVLVATKKAFATIMNIVK